MSQNQELPKEEKERITKQATIDILRVAELHGLTTLLGNPRILQFLIDVYAVGASMALKEAMRINNENK